MSSQSEPDSSSEREAAQSKSQEYQTESTARSEHKPRTRADAKSDYEEWPPYCPPVESPANDHGPTTTVMIYLAGDNNLTDECIYALTELKKARPSHLVKIYVQFDPSDEYLPTQRYEINRCGPDHYKGPLVEDLIDQFPFTHESEQCLEIKPAYGEQRERKGESGTGDPRMLFNFVAFCVDQPHKPQPAPKTDQYVLIICGHGAGIQRDFLLRDNRPDGYLTIYELRSALRLMRKKLKGKGYKDFKLNLFGMDVCLMSMAEITYELGGLVDIAIGCESYSPAAGWPYCETIKKIDFTAREKTESFSDEVWRAIAKEIVKAYVRFYSDYWLGGLSVAMSALDVRYVDRLKHLVRGLANEMIYELHKEWDEDQHHLYGADDDSKSKDEKDDKRRRRKRYPPLSFSDALTLAHWRTQSYNGELYVDLADFCDCLAEYIPEDQEIARLCHELAYFIRKHFVIESCTFGRNYQYSYGVSIYFPWQNLVPYYGASIRFPEESNWISFLNTYLKVTRRRPRFIDCDHLVEDLDDRLRNKLAKQNLSEVRMGPDRMGPDRMGLDEGGNPIHSMRNPPIVFIPDCCTEPEVRELNAKAQLWLMKDGLELKDMLPDPKIKALEAKNLAWSLLTTEQRAVPEQFEADNVDES